MSTRRALLLVAVSLCGCGGENGTPSPPLSNEIGLSQHIAYLGIAEDACRKNCLRGPNIGYDIHVSQVGNMSTFGATSSDANVITASLEMLGPAHSEPAIRLNPRKAGLASLTITGIGGMVARLPVVITTISRMTITLNGFPTAAVLNFSVMSPVSPACPGFAGGYSFNGPAPVPGSKSVTIGRFPAMGNGQSSLCLFTTVSMTVADSSGATLTGKTVTIPIALGHDNPTTITIP